MPDPMASLQEPEIIVKPNPRQAWHQSGLTRAWTPHFRWEELRVASARRWSCPMNRSHTVAHSSPEVEMLIVLTDWTCVLSPNCHAGPHFSACTHSPQFMLALHSPVFYNDIDVRGAISSCRQVSAEFLIFETKRKHYVNIVTYCMISTEIGF